MLLGTQGNAIKFNLIPSCPHCCACCCWSLVVNKPWATWCLFQPIWALGSKFTSGAQALMPLKLLWGESVGEAVSLVLGGNWAAVVLLMLLSLASTQTIPAEWQIPQGDMSHLEKVSLWHRPGEGAEQDLPHPVGCYGTCEGFGFGAVLLQPLIPWPLMSEGASSLWDKGLICNPTSAGLSLRGSVTFADWCAFWKCFSAKLALINKIYEGKEKLVLPRWVFFCAYD